MIGLPTPLVSSSLVGVDVPPDAIAMIAEEVVLESRANLRGALVRPGDEGYDVARRVWNGMIDKEPSLIVRCR